MRRASMIGAGAVLVIAAPTDARLGSDPLPGPPEFLTVLVAPDSGVGDELGRSVAYREPFLIAGAWGASTDSMFHHGAAQIWRFTPGGWISESFAIASDAAAEDRFGTSVAIARPTLLIAAQSAAVVGADGADLAQADDAGAAYVFRRALDGSWIEEAKLVAGDPQTNARFGRAVAIDGDVIAIGAPQRNDFRGAVYVFRLVARGPGDPVWIQEAVVTANDGAIGDALGASVGMAGNVIVAGAWGKDQGAGTNRGAVYVFSWNGERWVQGETLAAPAGAAFDELGRAVSIDAAGERIAAGATHAFSDQLAEVHVWERSGSPDAPPEEWLFEATLRPPEPRANDGFASTVSIEGDLLLVGAPARMVDDEPQRGAAFMFERNGKAGWIHAETFIDSTGDPGDAYGSSVAIHGEAAAIGARGYDLPATPSTGAVYLYWVVDCDEGGSFGICAAPSGDLNRDGHVDGADLATLLGAWGPSEPGADADLNGDGDVGGADLTILLGEWTG